MAEPMQFNPGSVAPAGLDKSLDELIKESKKTKAPKPRAGPAAGKKQARGARHAAYAVDAFKPLPSGLTN